MKKVMRTVSLLSILLITIVAFTGTTVFAALGSWTYHTYALNISGTSDAISGKMVNDPIGAYWTSGAF